MSKSVYARGHGPDRGDLVPPEVELGKRRQVAQARDGVPVRDDVILEVEDGETCRKRVALKTTIR